MINHFIKMIRDKKQSDYEIRKDGTGYYADSDKQEIGFIRYADCHKLYDLQYFRVKETWRNKHVGKHLLECVLADALLDDGIKYIRVYPAPDAYPGDSDISVELLYEIYWKLGFRFMDHEDIQSFEMAKQQKWFYNERQYMKLCVK